MFFYNRTTLIFVNLDHQRWIILLNHHTLWLPTQFSSVFFFCCSFLNDFPFLALVVKPVIYLSQRRRKNERKSFFIFYSLCSVFAFSKRLLEMTKGRMYLTIKKEGETCNIEVPVFSIFMVYYYALTRLDAIILKIRGIFWILENKRQTWQRRQQGWGSLLRVFVSRVKNE